MSAFGIGREHSDAAWCRQIFASIKPGGVWAVPRSGLVFRKEPDEPPTFRLFEVMPHDPGMPFGIEDLRAYQREDLETIREKFSNAGIAVIGEIES